MTLAQLTKILNTIVYGLCMSPEIILSWCFILTLVTWIISSFLKISLCCCMTLAQLTKVQNTIVCGFYVSPKIILSCCLILTLVTWIFNTFVYGSIMFLKISLCYCVTFAQLTKYLIPLCKTCVCLLRLYFLNALYSHWSHKCFTLPLTDCLCAFRCCWLTNILYL